MAEGRNLNSCRSKHRAMSRCSRQRPDVPKSLNFNVAPFGPMSQREECRDVIERFVF